MKRKPVERLWREEELVSLYQTFEVLRKIRTAATVTPSIVSTTIRNVAAVLGVAIPPRPSPQEALRHASDLVRVASDVLAARVSETRKKRDTTEEWQDRLSDTTRQYAWFSGATFARTRMQEAVRQTLIARLRYLHADPDHVLNLDFVQQNNLGVDSLPELLERDIGIISPLSGDYFAASIHQAYFRRTMRRTFALEPAALSQNLSCVVLPEADGKPAFSEKKEIGIFLDVIDTGSTGKALATHLRTTHPDATVHQPYMQKQSDFAHSEQFKRYWKALE